MRNAFKVIDWALWLLGAWLVSRAIVTHDVVGLVTGFCIWLIGGRAIVLDIWESVMPK